MYYYIFDIKKCKKRSQVESIKSYLGYLGISGEFVYPTAATSVPELVDLGLSKQYSTIVAIGDDDIANAVAAKLIGKKEAMGFIPLETTPSIASLIGVNSWKEACDTLRYRKINEIRLGRTATGYYFLTYIILGIKNPIEITLEFKDYIVQAAVKSFVVANYHPSIKKIQDDFLDILFTSVKTADTSFASKISSIFGTKKQDDQLNFSLLRGRSLRVFTKTPLSLICGNTVVAKTPQFIESSDEKIRIITAKNASMFWENGLK